MRLSKLIKWGGRGLICAFLWLSMLPQDAEAQILNIERMRLQEDTSSALLLKGTMGLNIYNRAAAADNPVEMFGYNAMLNAIYNPGRHALIGIAQFDYLSINDGVFLNFGFLHTRMIFNYRNRINPEAFVQYSYDNFRGLDPRLIGGAGARMRLLDAENLALLYGSSLMYEYEKWLHPVTEEHVAVSFLKWSNYLSFRASLSEYVDFNVIFYYQVGYDDALGLLRNRVSSTVNLNAKLSERFSWNNSFDFSFEDRPIVPVTKLVYAFRTGLSIDL